MKNMFLKKRLLSWYQMETSDEKQWFIIPMWLT